MHLYMVRIEAIGHNGRTPFYCDRLWRMGGDRTEERRDRFQLQLLGFILFMNVMAKCCYLCCLGYGYGWGCYIIPCFLGKSAPGSVLAS